MIADIEAGKVAHVIVKDMSRGCDYLQTGFYTEVLFRQHGVHFAAIANSVDSNDQNSNEYGKPTTNTAIYGYKKDPENKYHWLIDEEAAAVVSKNTQQEIASPVIA